MIDMYRMFSISNLFKTFLEIPKISLKFVEIGNDPEKFPDLSRSLEVRKQVPKQTDAKSSPTRHVHIYIYVFQKKEN